MRPLSDHSQKDHSLNADSSSYPSQTTEKTNCSNWFLSSAIKYWFVWLPILLFNTVLVIDQVVANNNGRAMSASLKSAPEAFLQDEDDDKLDQTLRSHWIQINKEGNLDGRISAIDPSRVVAIPIERLDISLVKKGAKVSTAVTDDEGKFVLEDVEPGVYTLIAAGQNGFLAYGIHVLPQLDEFDILDLDARANPDEAKRKFMAAHFNIPDNAIIEDELQIDAAAVPPEFTTLHQITQTYVQVDSNQLADAQAGNDLKAIDEATEIRGGFQFPLTFDGTFTGRVQPIATEEGRLTKLSDVNLFLIQDDLEVARAPIDENGRFSISNVKPGVYSLIAAGRDGFAAFSLELTEVAAEGDVSYLEEDSEYQLVSADPAPAAAPPILGIAIITDPADLHWIREEINRIFRMRQAFFNQDGLGQFFGQGGFPGGPGVAGGPVPGGIPFGPSFSPPIGGNVFIPYRSPGPGGGLLGLIPFALLPFAFTDDNEIIVPPSASPNTP